MCTAGMAMLGFALQPTRLHAACLLMRHFLTKIMLNPAEQARTICFCLPGPVQTVISSVWPLDSLIPPVSDGFYPHFHSISLFFHPHVDFLICMHSIWLPPPTTIHLGVLFVVWP